MGRKKTKKIYFSEREEQAVIDYIKSDSKEEKDKIYNEILKEPFRIMTESILRRYPIHFGTYDIYDIEKNALSHLIERMVTYDENRVLDGGRKARAYSYCQTIIRNYYRDHSEKSYKEKTNNLHFDDFSEEICNKDEYLYRIDDEKSDMEILIANIVQSIENKIKSDVQLKENEITVGYAIINILNNWNVLFLEDSPDGKYEKSVTNKYAKNKILVYLKEQTNLTTKEMRQAIKSFKDIYYLEKLNMINGYDEEDDL